METAFANDDPVRNRNHGRKGRVVAIEETMDLKLLVQVDYGDACVWEAAEALEVLPEADHG